MDDDENIPEECRNDMDQDEDPTMTPVQEGFFSSSSCEPKKKEEKRSSCGCKVKPKSSRSSKSSSKCGKSLAQLKKSITHYNPFIVFYLKTYYENPSKRVTEVAIRAAKIWCRMSDKDKAIYIKIAREESKRRQKQCIKVKRRKKC